MFKRFEIPDLHCPISSAVNEHVADAEKHSFEWAQRFALVPEKGEAYQALRAAKCAWFVGYPMRDASIDDLFLASDWVMWLFVHDDMVEGCTPQAEIASYHARLEHILDGGRARVDDLPMVQALGDLARRVQARAPAWWYLRFVDAVRQQLQSHIWEMTNTTQRRVPTLAAYMKLRPHVYRPCITLALIAKSIKPDAAFLRHAFIVAMTDMAMNQIVWVNDVIGINHEIDERSPHNLALVLQNELSIPLKDALQRAADMTNGEMKAFLELEEELPSFGDEAAEARAYVETLRFWMRGHLDWYRETARYPF